MSWHILQGDARHIPLADESVQCVVTSPPFYGTRDYTVTGQIGLEQTVQDYVEQIRLVFTEVWRILRTDGSVFLNLGDSYAGSWGNYHPNSPPGKHGQRLKETARWNRPAYQSQTFLPPTATCTQSGLKPKDMCLMPERVVLALQERGWWVRSRIPWIKRNAMPESIRDRPASAVEYMFMLTKNERYYWNTDAIRHPGAHGGQRRLRRNSDWFFESWQGLLLDEDGDPLACVVNTHGFPGAHFATFPPKLVEPLIQGGSRPGDIVVDPFGGVGTTPLVADRLGRHGIGLDLSPAYCRMAADRLRNETPLFASVVSGREHRPPDEGALL